MIVLLDWTHLSSSSDLHDVVDSRVIWVFNCARSCKMVYYKTGLAIGADCVVKQTTKKLCFPYIWTFHVPLTSLGMATSYQELKSRSIYLFLDLKLEIQSAT